MQAVLQNFLPARQLIVSIGRKNKAVLPFLLANLAALLVNTDYPDSAYSAATEKAKGIAGGCIA